MKKISFFILILFVGFITNAQQKKANNIKVGLVLSGGGAKGLAHIGTLKVIDSLGLKIDYIAGASMGAIVGGLYASGYTGNQIDSIFHKINYNNLIQDKIPRNAKTFYKKKSDEKYALSLPFVEGKVSLPKGISNGQNFYNFYSQITDHVRNVKNFKNFSIPFFCTGTDIETGKQIIFENGYLPDVVAASSALPTVFSPVPYNGKLVADGGIINNYPVEEIRKKGMDIIIGVDVQDSLVTRKEMKTVADIMIQINNFNSIKDMEKKGPMTDIYIKPNIEEFSILSFDDGKKIIEEGKKSTLKLIGGLKKIVSQQAKKHNRTPVKPNKKIKIDKILIEDNINYTRNYINGKLSFDIPSEIEYEDLTDGLNNLYSTGNFERIRYKIKTNAINQNILDLKLTENSAKRFIKFGLHYDDLLDSGALINYTHNNLLLKNDVLSADFVIGDNFRHTIEYYVDQGIYWSVGINNRLYRYEKDIDFSFVRDRRGLPDLPVSIIEIDYTDVTSQLYLETIFKHKLGFRIGAEHKYLRIKTNTFDEDIPGTVFDELSYYGLFGSLKLDNMNDEYFPSKGLKFTTNFNTYPLSSESNSEYEEFAIAKSRINYAIPITKNFSGLICLEAGLRLGESTGINSLDFFLGGYGTTEVNNQIPFLGYDFLEISGDSYIKSKFQIDYNFLEKHHITATANYSNVGNKIFDVQQWIDRVGYSGYGIGYGLNTGFGPIQIKYAFSPDESTEDQVFISIGYWF